MLSGSLLRGQRILSSYLILAFTAPNTVYDLDLAYDLDLVYDLDFGACVQCHHLSHLVPTASRKPLQYAICLRVCLYIHTCGKVPWHTTGFTSVPRRARRSSWLKKDRVSTNLVILRSM